jgi:hydrogenase nickel incorporation protein HypA/HybF
MHEMGIAQSILSSAEAVLSGRPGARLLSVGLRIGDWAGVDAGSLRFCFEALTKGTSGEGAALEIEAPGRSDALEIAYFELEQP